MPGRRAASSNFSSFLILREENFQPELEEVPAALDCQPALRRRILIELQTADAIADFNVGTVAF